MSDPKSVTLASLLHRFFVDYLPRQRALSPHTLCSYRDSIKLLLQFFARKHGDISKLAVEDLTIAHITVFLQHLEVERSNCTGTRNVRLSAIHSFFRYLGEQCPEHLAQAQRILGVPFKRTSTRGIQHLDLDEIQAVLRTVDPNAGSGPRDLALLSLMFNTGLASVKLLPRRLTTYSWHLPLVSCCTVKVVKNGSALFGRRPSTF